MFSKFVLMLGTTILLMQVLFTPSGNVLWTVPISWLSLTITDQGILKGILLTLRFLNIILLGGVFVATTEPALLVHSLMKAGVPYRYGFIPLFEEEMTTIGNAQKMRGLELDRVGPRKLVLSIRYMILPLVVSALSKADALEISMEGRAFGYKDTRTFLSTENYSFLDKALIASSIAALTLLVLSAVIR